MVFNQVAWEAQSHKHIHTHTLPGQKQGAHLV